MHWVGDFINNDHYPNIKLDIGRHSYGRPKILAKRDESRSLSIGSFCSIAECVTIFVGAFGIHPTQLPSTFPLGQLFGQPQWRSPDSSSHLDRCLDVKVGNDVWIGRGVTVLAGVTIGDGAVIGTNALVTRDVEPYSIVAGVPARQLRYRFSAEVIRELLKLRWWEYSDAHIKNKLSLFYSSDITEFLREFPRKDR